MFQVRVLIKSVLKTLSNEVGFMVQMIFLVKFNRLDRFDADYLRPCVKTNNYIYNLYIYPYWATTLKLDIRKLMHKG